MTSDILFTPAGKRFEKVTDAPPPTLQRISLSQQDLDDLEHVQPFVLTSEELPKYDVKYIGREQVDELSTYVFDVGPKKIEKNQRYFQGRIWVDDKDLNIVKSDGKAVPDIIKKNNENIFPRFETFRENIEGHFWFPTYTRCDDVLHFRTGPEVRIQALFRDRFVGAVRSGHPLSEGTVTPERYAAGRHISISRRGREKGPIDEALSALGLQRTVVCMVSGFSAALAMARASELIASVPERHTAGARAGMHSFPLPVVTVEVTISMLWHPRLDADPAQRWLRDCVREVCAGR